MSRYPDWWKHGNKVQTRNDGVLTLNIAPDAEWWLTNAEGKEVYVFVDNILGPYETLKETQGKEQSMTNNDELAQKLKSAAEKAGAEEWQVKRNGPGEYEVMVKGSLVKHSGWSTHRPVADEIGDKKTADFIATACPANILALLAEREADKKRIAEAYAGWGNCQLTMGVYCHAYEEAKAHITELIHNHRVKAARLIDERARLKERIAELEARTVSVKFSDGWHFEECETEGCQNGAIFSVGKAANNIHLCEACTKEPVYARFTKTALPKRLPFNLAAGIKLEVGEQS